MKMNNNTRGRTVSSLSYMSHGSPWKSSLLPVMSTTGWDFHWALKHGGKEAWARGQCVQEHKDEAEWGSPA